MFSHNYQTPVSVSRFICFPRTLGTSGTNVLEERERIRHYQLVADEPPVPPGGLWEGVRTPHGPDRSLCGPVRRVFWAGGPAPGLEATSGVPVHSS